MSKTDKDQPLKFRYREGMRDFTNDERTVVSPDTVRFFKHLRHRRMRALERTMIARGDFDIPDRIDYDYRYILAD